MIDVPKTQAAKESDGSRSSLLSRMMKQPWANARAASAEAPAKVRSAAGAPSRITPDAAGASTASVDATIIIKGDISGKGDLIVSGTIEGTVDLAHNFVSVEESGRVQGSIVAKRVRISGKVVGDVEALEKLTISASGKAQGTIAAPRIEVEDGAKFMGGVDMDFDDARAVAPSVSLLKD